MHHMHNHFKIAIGILRHPKPIPPLDAAAFTLFLIYAYWVGLFVIMWPGRHVVVRNRMGPPGNLSVLGRFVFSIPFCVCVWRDLAPPRRRFRFYWLFQVRLSTIRSTPTGQPVAPHLGNTADFLLPI